MLRPSGVSWSTTTSAPSARNTRGATCVGRTVRAVDDDLQAVERRDRRAPTTRCVDVRVDRVVPRSQRRCRPRRTGAAVERVRRPQRSISASTSSAACGRRRDQLDAVVGPRVVAGGDHRCGRVVGLREVRDAPASGSTPSATTLGTRQPRARGTRSASMRGPDSRVSRPTTNDPAPEHPRRGASERDDECVGEVGVGVAADTVGAEPQHVRRGSTASSTAAPCGPSSGRTCAVPSHARRA